jgi:hypothetical protein
MHPPQPPIRNWLRMRFSLSALLTFMLLAGTLAGWLGRSERQRRAIQKLRALDEHRAVSYSFQGEGPCAGMFPGKPNWLARKIGIDLFYNATSVCVDAEHLSEAIPLLKRLSGLKEIHVGTDSDDLSLDRSAAAQSARIQAGIELLQKEFPRVKVGENPGCPITVSTVPIVG